MNKAGLLSLCVIIGLFTASRESFAGERVSLGWSFNRMVYSPDFHLSPAAGYGISAGYFFHPKLQLGARVSWATPQTTFDLVTGHETLDIHFVDYQVFAEYQVLPVSDIFTINLTAATGFAILSTDERIVSLGALGQRRIPETSETKSSLVLGVVFLKELSSWLSIRLQPNVIFYSPLRLSQSTFLIGGGINLATP
jgi:hypothetical protein